MVRELFEMARGKKACIIFFDEVDAIGGARFDDGAGGDNEVQRTMLELINQLDGFDARGNIKVLMATNRCVSPLARARAHTRPPVPCGFLADDPLRALSLERALDLQARHARPGLAPTGPARPASRVFAPGQRGPGPHPQDPRPVVRPLARPAPRLASPTAHRHPFVRAFVRC